MLSSHINICIIHALSDSLNFKNDSGLSCENASTVQLIKTNFCTYWLFDEEGFVLRRMVRWHLNCINSIRKYCKKKRPRSQCHIVSDSNIQPSYSKIHNYIIFPKHDLYILYKVCSGELSLNCYFVNVLIVILRHRI